MLRIGDDAISDGRARHAADNLYPTRIMGIRARRDHIAVKRTVGWWETPTSPHVDSSLDGGYSDCLRPLGALLDFELNALILRERLVAVALDL
jgi:hypothetical protein